MTKILFLVIISAIVSLRIETSQIGDENRWNLFQKILPGSATVFDQILSDGAKVYIVECDFEDNKSILYVNRIPAKRFNEKLINGGVHVNEDFDELLRIEKGEEFKMSLKTSEETPRLVYRFRQE